MKNLIWFRNDLRTKDNNSLAEACAGNKEDGVIGIYFFDPRQFEKDEFGFKKTERFRARFLIETVTNLRKNLRNINIPLLVFLDKPENILPDFVQKHEISSIYLQEEWTPEERMVFNSVKAKLDSDIQFVEVYDQFLYHPDDIPYADFQEIPNVFTQMRKQLEAKSEVRKLIDLPETLPQENLTENNTEIPALQYLGLDDFELDLRSAFPFKGGEDAALERMNNYFWETEKSANYKKTCNGLIGSDYSSKFSAWLANGSISPRTIYWEVQRFEREVQKNDSTYWLIFELIWRDFFKFVSLKHGDKIFQIGGILDKEYDWKNNMAARKEWIEGRTKYNFVNANMREIARTGFMSNRGRQNVASFWARELEQYWRVGAAYFESLLVDYDVHSNWGNWMYNSGVGNDPRDRKFNIQSQADRYDGIGEYQRLWLQEELF